MVIRPVYPQQILFLVGAVISLIVLLVGWPRRRANGGMYFAAFACAVTWWQVASFMEASVTTQANKIFWSQVSYPGFTQAYPLLVLFILTYVTQRRIPTSMVLGMLVIPWITTLLAWTNPLHGWVWTGFSQGSVENNVLIYHHGFWFWVNVVYLYGLMVIGLSFIIYNIFHSNPFVRRQLMVILIGSLFPIASGTMYVLGFEPVKGMDVTPTGLVFTGVFLAWGLLRYELLDLRPVARTALVDQFQDGVVVLDLKGRIADINHVTRDLLGWDSQQVIGKEFGSVFPAAYERGVDRQELILPGPPARTVELQSSPLKGDTHVNVGTLLVLRDVSARKQAEQQLRDNEEKYRAFIEESLEGITLVNDIGMIVEWNHARETLTGLKREDTIGRYYWDVRMQLSPPWERSQERLERLRVGTLAMLRSGESEQLNHKFEGRLVTSDGVEKIIEQISFPVRIHDGFWIGSVMSDITERKQAEEGVRRRVQEMETVNRISLLMRGLADQGQLLGVVLDEALGIIETVHGAVELYHRASGRPERRITRGWVAGLARSTAGLEAQVIASGEMQATRDFTAPEATDVPGEWGAVFFPLRTAQQVLGVLTVCIPGERQLDSNETRLISILAEMTGAALQRMQLYEETERRAEEFAALYETTKAISANTELGSVLAAIVDHAKTLLHASSTGIYLHLEESDELLLAVETAEYNPVGIRMRMGEGVAGRVAQTRQPLRIDDYATWEGRSDKFDEIPIHAVLEVPMLYGGELVGVLTADEAGASMRKFTEADERLLSLFASQAAGAIRSARMHEKTVRRLERLQALRAVDQAISSNHNMRQTLDILLAYTISQLEVDAADVLLLGDDAGSLELVGGRGFRSMLLRAPDWDSSYAALAIRDNLPVFAMGTTQEVVNTDFAEFCAQEGFVQYWCAPLVAKGGVKGVLEIYKRGKFIPDSEWLGFLEALAGQAAIAVENNQLFENLQRANRDLREAYDATIEGWSQALDLRDHETEGHTLRVTETTLQLARAMQVSERQLVVIRRGALLHDIGKLGVPDAILLKEGRLTTREWDVMRRHPDFARMLLEPISYLKNALDIPYCHHERWDGMGYPRGLAGEDIPLFARIFAVVDVWDALTNDRPYRKRWNEDEAKMYILSQSGRHFDPHVVDAFMVLLGANEVERL